MAKGNMFLGQSRGKVGDLVFYRQEGEQIARTRNRHPRNPRTEPQQYQRAIMATVTAAYKAGRTLFDHAFEGFSVGAQNQREFLRQNARLLRSLIAGDLAAGRTGAATVGRVVGPGTNSPVGFPGMVVAAGNYPMAAFRYTAPDTDAGDPAMWALPAPLTDETRVAYSSRIGLISNDIFTFVMFYYDVDIDPIVFRISGVSGQAGALQYRQHFAFLRLRVKESFVTSADAVGAATIDDVFILDSYSPDIDTVTISQQGINEEFTLDGIVTAPGGAEGYMTLIRSREDVDVRSNSTLVWASPSGYAGISSEYVLAAWTQGTDALGHSDLILEGGGFGRLSSLVPAVTPSLFMRMTSDNATAILVTAEGKIATNSEQGIFIYRNLNNWFAIDDNSGFPLNIFNQWSTLVQDWGIDTTLTGEYAIVYQGRRCGYIQNGDFRVLTGTDDGVLYEPSEVPDYRG